jgi:polar amino acid transport system substrate-binding protein
MLRHSALVTAAAGALFLTALAGCGDDDDAGTASTAPTEEGACDPLPLKEAGALTVATGEPAFEPWVVDDDPTNQEGFESAVVYAVAEELGIEADAVSWVRSGFDEAIAPGEKDYDFNVQQFGITPERDEVVDFSDGYYEVEQAIVAADDNDIASATSLADLKTARLGAAIGTTSLDYIEEVIQPDADALVFDDNAAAKAAFDAGQVDGIVFDLPTAYYITAVEIEGSSIVGVLPVQGEVEELGFLFEDGSPLVDCVNEAIATLTEDGTLDELQETWLNQGGDIPTLEP